MYNKDIDLLNNLVNDMMSYPICKAHKGYGSFLTLDMGSVVETDGVQQSEYHL